MTSPGTFPRGVALVAVGLVAVLLAVGWAEVGVTPTVPGLAPAEPVLAQAEPEVPAKEAEPPPPTLPQTFVVPSQGDCHAENPLFQPGGDVLLFECRWGTADIDLLVANVHDNAVTLENVVRFPGVNGPRGERGSYALNPTWHSYGVLVFEGSDQGGAFRLHFQAPVGQRAAELLSWSKMPGDQTFPAISPNGDLLAFVSDQQGNGDIVTWNRTNDEIEWLTDSAESEMFPTFSRDGARLFFTRRGGQREDVYVLDLATGQEGLVAGGPGDQSRPIEAAGGQILFFDSRPKRRWALQMVPSPGADPITLARNVRLPTRSRTSLSPDGNWVTWTTPGAPTQVFVGKVDGSETIEVTTTRTVWGDPALGERNGHTLLAYTAFTEPDSPWQTLYVTDITAEFQTQP